jgi:hypothetical protein
MDRTAPIGILMLDSNFPRVPGDMGNAATWSCPVVFRVVKDASPDHVVRQGARGLLAGFIAAAKELEAEGAALITTTCGFLCTFQKELAAEVSVPVLTSSLFQVAGINALLPKGKCAGILTISKESLSPDHLKAAEVPDCTPIAAPSGHFVDAILNDRSELDISEAERENVEAAIGLIEGFPEVGVIVLECTNMTPYAGAIQREVKCPVFSIVSYVNWFRSAVSPQVWP